MTHRAPQLWTLSVFAVAALLPVLAAQSETYSVIVVGLCGLALMASLVGTRVYLFLLALYLIGLLSLSRTFAVIGVPPVFLPEALFVGVTVSGLRIWWPHLRSNWGFAVCALALLVLDVNALLRGIEAGYPSALKGAVLGIWPGFAVVFACLMQARPRYWEAAPLLIVPVALGLIVSPAVGIPVTASAVGVYLLVPVAFLSAPYWRGRRRLLFAGVALLAFALLTLDVSKRGPTLAVLVACLATRLATRTDVKARGVAALMIIATAAGVGMYAVAPSTFNSLPVLGGVAQRLQASIDPSSESGANILVRVDFWKYAISTVIKEQPLTGVGTGHPIEVSYRGADFGRQDIGPHNSFVGYAFYLGIPSALLVLGAFVLALCRCWHIRCRNRAAPAMFGAIAGLAILVATNVVFETTYIGGPAWLMLGGALSLRASKARSAVDAPPETAPATATAT